MAVANLAVGRRLKHDETNGDRSNLSRSNMFRTSGEKVAADQLKAVATFNGRFV